MLHMYCTCQASQKKFIWSQQEHKSSSVHMPCLVQAEDILHLPRIPKNKQRSKVVEMTWKALHQLSCSEACSRMIMAEQKTTHFLICSLIGIAYYLLVTALKKCLERRFMSCPDFGEMTAMDLNLKRPVK